MAVLTKPLDVQPRVAGWLLLFVAIVTGSGAILWGQTRARLTQSAQDSLGDLVELEDSRIERAIIDLKLDLGTVAGNPRLVANLGASPAPEQDSGEVLELLLAEAQLSGQDFTAFLTVERSGAALGRTAAANGLPSATALAETVMSERTIRLGAVTDRGVVAASPIVSDVGEVLGALVVLTRLDPLVRQSQRYEAFGDTSEAFVFQRLADGRCQLLTDLRFDRSAQFSMLDGELGAHCRSDDQTPLFDGIDYRGEETFSAWSDIVGTDWGVAVKTDTSEAYALLHRVQLIIALTAIVAACALLGGWLTLVRSIGHRLSRAASTAEELASGNFGVAINDRRSDEIGRMSASMDRLARDLADDIERRKAAEAQLRLQAQTDELTGLLNRRRMSERLHELFAEHRNFAVIFLDLDGFKEINDIHGHSVGDDVLRLAASRMQTAVDLAGLDAELARWGGDEFVILCPDRAAPDIDRFTSALDTHFDRPFRTTAGEHYIGVSIGTADSNGGAGVDEVMSLADAAMYRMKRVGRRPQVSAKAIRFVEDALQRDAVVAMLQPVARLEADMRLRITGAEALVRIETDDGSLAGPASFLSGLGSSDTALALDLRVLTLVAQAAARWHHEALVAPDFAVSVNLGAAALADERIVAKVSKAISDAGLRPENLVVEIPETAHEVDVGRTEELRALGVRIAIDDVGCQFSNLERLADIPADIAKIDRRWLPRDGTSDENRVELFDGLVKQCRTFGLTVVVEGVETADHLDVANDAGVDRVQGFFMGQPATVDRFERLFTRPGGDPVHLARPLVDGEHETI